MDVLRIPLTRVLDRGCPVDATVDVSALQPAGAAALPVSDIRVRGLLEDAGGTFLFRGRVSGVFTAQCDRCLGEARVPVEVETAWIFENGPAERAENEEEFDEDAGECSSRDPYTFDGATFDLGPAAWEELALAAPFKYLCRESCAGLCARCGANLNDGPCGCPADSDGQRTDVGGLAAGLAAMFPELRTGDKRS